MTAKQDLQAATESQAVAQPAAELRVRYAAGSHVGLKRGHNEDNFFLLAEENLYVVADGMGGHACGEVASQIAVETLANFFIDTARDKEITWPYRDDKAVQYDENRLVTGIKLANRRIYEVAQSDARYRGMGTTIVTLSCGAGGLYVGHVGDSRGYLIRDGQIAQVTEDHSLLNDYLKVHKLSAEDIAHFPHKNVIVRALGMKDSVAVEINRVHPQPGDLFMLCSDGLSGMLEDQEMLARCSAAAQPRNLEALCQSLIAGANENGGHDNITVVLVEFSN